MGAPRPPQPPGAAHRDHEGVPGGGEDLGALVPAVAPAQLGQEPLWLDLQDRCWGSCGGCTPTLSPPCQSIAKGTRGTHPPRCRLASVLAMKRR